MVGLLAVALASWAGGYLREIGPVPIRMQPTPAPAPPVTLAPLPPAVTNVVTTPAPEPNTTVEPPPSADVWPEPDPIWSVTAGDSGTNFISSILGPLMSTPEQQLLTPQMLLQYFRELEGETNTSKVVVAPVTFVPPVPIIRPGSKATYNITPPPAPMP